jgi:peroxiredoxin
MMAREVAAMIPGRLFLVAALLITGLGLVGCEGDESAESAGLEGITQGKVARDFTLESLDGTRVFLSDYRGQVVLVNFWATWCPPCQEEIPDLEAAYQAHRHDGLVILGIDVEEPAPLIESFLDDVEMTYPILLDQTAKVYREYRAPGLPMTLVLDREGVIQVRHPGYLSAEQLAGYLDQVLLAP